MTDQASPATPDVIQQQAGKLVSHVGGFVAHRTVEMGLRHGFRDVEGVDLTPVHNVIYGAK